MPFELTWPWLALLGLGAFHGINPAMGWLFAVALGLQEHRRIAVMQALLPLAAGHALAVGVAVLAMALAGQLLPLDMLRWVVAAPLLGSGLFHLVRHRHPRYGGMRVGVRQLTVWSFLMASAHGAGLMVLPFLFGADAPAAHHDHASHVMHPSVMMIENTTGGHSAHLLAGLPSEPLVGLAATAVHTAGYLVVLGLIAVVVYEKLGLRLLRTHWLNLDVVWAAALIATAALTLLVG